MTDSSPLSQPHESRYCTDCDGPATIIDYRWPEDDWCDECHQAEFPEHWTDWDAVRKCREACRHG